MAQQPPAPPQPPPVASPRPPVVTTASVLLFVIGGLRAIFGLLGLVVILGATDVADEQPGLYAFAIALVLVALVAAGLQIAGGVGTLRLRRTGFRLAIIGSVIGAGARLIDILISYSADYATPVYTTIGLLVIALDVLIISILMQHRARFTT
jgi:hypothetical protein